MTRKGLVAALLSAAIASPLTPAIAGEEPVVSITPKQEKDFLDVYYNCDHEGTFGCLQIDCKQGGADPAEIQYLYRDVSQNFPELLTPALRACFVRAGGRFR